MEKNDLHNDLGIILSMSYIAWADGSIKEEELETIKQEMIDQELDEDEKYIVKMSIFEKPKLNEISKYITNEVARKSALVSAYVLALVDGNLDMKELNAIEELRKELRISKEDEEEIRKFAFERYKDSKDGKWNMALLLEEFI